MRKILLCILGLWILGVLFVAITKKSVSIPGDKQTTSTAAPAVVKKSTVHSKGAWTVSTNHNTVDNSVTQFVYMSFPEPVSGTGMNEVGITCSKGKVTEAYVTPWRTNGSNQLDIENYDSNSQRVRFRIDQGKPIIQWWDVSTNFHSLFLPIRDLRSMEHAEAIMVEFQPDFEVRQTANIPIEGLDVALKEAGCKI